jgi:hypothetical protein
VQADILAQFPGVSGDGIRNFGGHSAQDHEEIFQAHYASNES